jgi:murein DD-endopeptidase MepM/ murein hydrolase activator NlpD
MTEFVHKTRHALALYPRQHMALVALLLMLITSAALLIPSTPAQAKRTTIALGQPILTATQATQDSSNPDNTTAITVSDATLMSQDQTTETSPISTDALLVIAPSTDKPPMALVMPSEEKEWHAITVRDGDTMATIFKRLALSQTVLHALTQVESYKNAVTKIFPGQQLEFSIANGELLGFKAHLSEIETVVFEKKRNDESYRANKIVRVPETVRQYKHAEIKNSLFTAGMEAGLSHTMILELANVLGGEIDFALDPRKGDTIDIIYEEKWLDGQKVGEGEILAASYTNEGETHTAYRYVDRNGDTGYFSRDGVSMRKAFMRAPLDFTRVSSGFNPNRLHPIFKTRRPHRGIDYAAPVGTPVYAAGDGRVVTSSYSGSNGNYVVLQHGAYQTKYLHLSKRFVKGGQHVSQHQLIGAVGSTGYATGPHLHYEFLVNGVHQDPGKILKKMPKAVAIAASEQARFKTSVGNLQNQFAAYKHNFRVAQADTAPASSMQ